MRTRITVVCPMCKKERELRPADAKRTTLCRTCHNRQIAPLGYRATAEKYGEQFALQAQRQYRIDHPSNLEQLVTRCLVDSGIQFERETVFTAGGKSYLLDFVIDRQVIEVNGNYAHSFHADRDERKLAALQAAGLDVLILTDEDFKTAGYRDLILSFVR